MSFGKIITFMQSLFAAQTIEPEIVGFSGVTLEQSGNIFALIGTILCEIIYGLVKWVLAVVDFLQYFIQKLIGLDYWLQPGSKTIQGATDNDLLFQFLYNDTVQNVFRAMVGVFIILLIVFVIFAIVKTEWKYATGDGKGGNSKMQIFRSSFKAFILVLVFPLVLTLGIISSNAILASLVGALNLNMAQTFGGTLFSIAAEPANKYRIYASTDSKAPVSQRITFYVENSSGKTVLFSNGTQYPEDKNCIYIPGYGSYLQKIYSGDCTEYTVDTLFDVVVPRKEKSFSGYCVGLDVDGTTKYFLVKCDYSEKEGMYYYLRNILNGRVLSKNVSTNNNQGMTGNTVTELRKDLKDYIENTGKQSFISNANLHDFGSGAVIDAAYNTWGYSSVYGTLHTFEEAQSFGMVYPDVLGSNSNDKYGLSSISSAKISFNSNAVSPYFDGGQFGYVAKQAEYKVMADVIDFICNNNADLYMIDVTSSTINWNYSAEYQVESKWIGGGSDRKVNISAGASGSVTSGLEHDHEVLPFVVAYSDLCNDADIGNQLYLAHYNTSSELEGAVYVMCWKVVSGGRTQYVPLVNGKGYYDEATATEFPTFKSDFYSNGYRGLVVAKGLLNNETTNQEYGEPTYISSGIDGATGKINGIEAPYYYELTKNSEMYQYATEVTGKKSATVDSHNTYTISGVNIANVDGSASVGNLNGRQYFAMSNADGSDRSTSSADIEGMTIHLQNTSLSSITAKYAGLAMEFEDSDIETTEFNNNSKYLFVTGDGGYFVVSANKNSKEYFIHEISYSGGTATVGTSIANGARFETMQLSTNLKVYYDNDSNNGTVDVTTTGVKLNMFESTTSKVDGKSVFKTVDMYYVAVSAITFAKTMYMNVSFDTTGTNLFSYDEDNKFKVAQPISYSAGNTEKLQGTVFFNINYYDYTTGYVSEGADKGLWKGDLYNSGAEPTEVTEPILTEIFGVNKAGFSWADDSVSYNLYDGDRYVATIYKDSGTECSSVEALASESTHIMMEYNTFYNVRKQNTYTNLGAFKDSFANLRSSAVVSFNRDSLGTSAFIFDFRISLLGKGRLKLIMSTYEVEIGARKGYFYTSDSMAFDYFFDGEGKVNGNKITLSTFYVPSKVSSPFGVGLWIMLISSALIIKILGTALWGIIKRFYEITLYYIAMPAVASTIVLDDGKRFNTSIQQPLIAKVLSTYGVILGINAFFVLLVPVRSMSNVFTAEDIATSGSYFLKALSNLPLFGSFELTAKLLNAYTYILFLLVAFTMIKELPQLITTIMGTGKGGGDVVASGEKTKKAVKETVKDAGNMLSGQSMLDGAAETVGMAKGMIPGSALVSAGAGALGNLFKGGGKGGASNREDEEDDDGSTSDDTHDQTTGTVQNAPGTGEDDAEEKIEDAIESERNNDLDEIDPMNPEVEDEVADAVTEEILTEGGGDAVTAVAEEVTEAVTGEGGDAVTAVADEVTEAVTGKDGEVVDKVADVVENATGEKVAEEAGKKAGEEVKQEGKEDGKPKSIMEEASEKSDKWWKGIKEGVTKFGKAVASPFVAIGHGVATGAKWVGDKAKSAGHWVGNKFHQAKEGVKNIAGKVYGATLKPLGEGAKKLVEKGKNALMTGASWVRNTAGRVKTAVVGSKFVQGVTKFAGGVKNKFMDGASWVRNTAGRAKNWVVGAAGKVKDVAVGVATKVKDTAVGAVNRVKDSGFGKFVRKSVVNTIAVGMTVGKAFKAAGSGIGKAAQAVYGKVLTPIGHGAKKIAEKASQGVSWVKQHSGTIKKVAKVAGAVGLTALTVANPMAGLAVGAGFVAAKAVKNVAVGVYGSVLKPIGQKAKSIAQKAQEGVSYVAKGISSGVGAVGGAASSVAGGISARMAKRKGYVKNPDGQYVPAGTGAGVAEKPAAMSKAESDARDELETATQTYESAKADRIDKENTAYTRKRAENKKKSNAKKREQLQEAFNNAEYGADQDRISAEIRALDADDAEQDKIIADNQVTDEQVVEARAAESTAKKAKTQAKKKVESVIIAEAEQAEADAKRAGMSEQAGAAQDALDAATTVYEEKKKARIDAENALYEKKQNGTATKEDEEEVARARKEESEARSEKSKAKKHLSAVLKEEAGGVNPEKVADARANFKEKNKTYNDAKTERINAEESIAKKEKTQKKAKKKIAQLEQQLTSPDKLDGENEGEYIQRKAKNADIERQIAEQRTIIADNQVTEDDKARLETAKKAEDDARVARATAREQVTMAQNNPTVVTSPSPATLDTAREAYPGQMPAVVRGSTSSGRTSTEATSRRGAFIPADEGVVAAARANYDDELTVPRPILRAGRLPQGTTFRLSSTANAARANARGESENFGVNVDTPRSSSTIARERFNLDSIHDNSTVADLSSARANVVRNQTNTRVGMQISARSIARLGGNASNTMAGQIYAAVNGNGSQAGLLTPAMKEQIIMAILPKIRAEQLRNMNPEDRQKVLETYKVVGGLQANGGIGFAVTDKNGNSSFAGQEVSADVVGQMMSSGKISNANINASIAELGHGNAIETQLSRNLALGVDYSTDLSRTTNSTDSRVYNTVMNNKKYDNVVAEGILRYVTANPESSLYENVSKDLGIRDVSELNNPATMERVIEQIARMRRSEGTNSINSIKPAEYAGEVAAVMQEKAMSGTLNITAWDYASTLTRAGEIANVEALRDGTVREDLSAAERRLSRQAVQDNKQSVLLNAFANDTTVDASRKSGIVNQMLRAGNFATISANDKQLLEMLQVTITQEQAEGNENLQLVKTAGQTDLMLAMKKAIMLGDVSTSSDRAGLSADVLAKYLKGSQDIDTALLQKMSSLGMNRSVKGAVGALESQLTQDEVARMLTAVASQGTLGLSVGENRNLNRMLDGSGIDASKLSYFEATAILNNVSPETVAVQIERESSYDREMRKLAEAQGGLVLNTAVKSELEKGDDANSATASSVANAYAGKMQTLSESDIEQIKLATAKSIIEQYNSQNPDSKVDVAGMANYADVASAVKGNASLSAQIEVASLGAVYEANKQRLAMGMGERLRMYAAVIQEDPSLYNKARASFRQNNPGQDLDEVDSMRRNSFLANEFARTLTEQDRPLVEARFADVDTSYVQKMAGLSKADAEALIQEAKKAGMSIDAILMAKGHVSQVGTGSVDAQVIASMNGREFTEVYNGAKRDGDNYIVHGVETVKRNILEHTQNATPAVDVEAMTDEQRSRFEFTRNFLQQMNRTGENPSILANTFRNVTLYDNDRVVEEMAKIRIDGQDEIDASLSTEEKKQRLSNEQINAYLNAHEEYRDILTTYAAGDVTRTLDAETRKESLYKLATENPELDAQVRKALKEQGINPQTASKDDYSTILELLAHDNEAFRNALYSKLTERFDPSARLTHQERVAFFENNATISQSASGSIQNINEWLSKFISSDGQDTGNVILHTRTDMPESSSAYQNWNSYIDSRIREVESKKGDYAGMSADERKAEIEKLRARKIDGSVDATQLEKNKRDAFAVGDFTELYNAGVRVAKVNGSNVRAIASRNGWDPNTPFDVLAGDKITASVEERHRAELAEAQNINARYKASSAMRTSSDFGENFSALATSYLGSKGATQIASEVRKIFLEQFKGQTQANGAKITANFRYENLTAAQQQALRDIRKRALENMLSTNVSNARKQVNYDEEMRNYDSWMQRQGLVPEEIRYTDGSKKYTQRNSQVSGSGTTPAKSSAQRRADQMAYLTARDDYQSVVTFNDSTRTTNREEYVASLRRRVSGTSVEKAVEELLASTDAVTGRKFTSQSVSIQKVKVEELLRTLQNRAESRMNSHYGYIPAEGRTYVGKTFTMASTSSERELQRTKLEELRKSLGDISSGTGSFDVKFNSLSASVRNSFMNTMSKSQRNAFNSSSEFDKMSQLQSFLTSQIAKLETRVRANNFFSTNTSALTALSGRAVQRTVSSAETREVTASLSPSEKRRYSAIEDSYRRASESLEAEVRNYRRLAQRYESETSQTKKVEILREMHDSSVVIQQRQTIVKEIEQQRRDFISKVETTRSTRDVRVDSGLGTDRSRNFLRDYNISTKGKPGAPSRPVRMGGPLDKPMNMMIFRFLERYKNQIQNMYKTEIYQQTKVIQDYTRGKINKLSSDLSRTIVDNRQLRRYLKTELRRIEGSLDANDIRLRNALTNDIARLESAENELKTELQSLGIDISSMERKVDDVSAMASRRVATPATKPTTKK